MQVTDIIMKNFASYKTLDFYFYKKGLVLVHGPTGSGKSTLCDCVPWVLFGRTAKDGAVDEVISWNSDAPTSGTAILENNMQITRVRGKGSNDLYYKDSEGNVVRGKDLADTQKLINNLLGVDSDLYLAGAYFHEFSQTAQFFTTSPKNRRTICEQIVDLSLPVKLNAKISSENKLHKEYLGAINESVRDNTKHLEFLNKRKSAAEAVSTKFEHNKLNEILLLEEEKKELQTKADEITNLNNKLLNIRIDLSQCVLEKCGECGGPKNADKAEQLRDRRESVRREIAVLENNVYRINYIDREINKLKVSKPTNVEELSEEIRGLTVLLTDLDDAQTRLSSKIVTLDLLSEVVAQYRSDLVKNAILQVEYNTNQLLSDFFDAEIKVAFSATIADKLDVTIEKDGNTCSYTQLSKGQRCLLKLCFGVAVMRMVAKNSSARFPTIAFDEALDGLDDNFKLKCFTLLKSLESEYDTILVVEHNEGIKAMFDTSYEVQLVNDTSVIT